MRRRWKRWRRGGRLAPPARGAGRQHQPVEEVCAARSSASSDRAPVRRVRAARRDRAAQARGGGRRPEPPAVRRRAGRAPCRGRSTPPPAAARRRDLAQRNLGVILHAPEDAAVVPDLRRLHVGDAVEASSVAPSGKVSTSSPWIAGTSKHRRPPGEQRVIDTVRLPEDAAGEADLAPRRPSPAPARRRRPPRPEARHMIRTPACPTRTPHA